MSLALSTAFSLNIDIGMPVYSKNPDGLFSRILLAEIVYTCRKRQSFDGARVFSQVTGRDDGEQPHPVLVTEKIVASK